MIRFFFTLPIRLYQKTISPDHGYVSRLFPYGYCKFYPSCSEYALIAIEQKGVIKGVLLGTYRILRCNPFTKGGVDLSCRHQIRKGT